MHIVNYDSPNAARDFVDSLRETGFGVLENHPLDQELLRSIYENWQRFFDSQQKYDYLYSDKEQDGYYPLNVSETAKGNTVRDVKEFYHIYPRGRIPEQLRDDAMAYYQQTSTFAAELLSWVERYSPPEVAKHYSEPLSQMIKDTQHTLLRVLHYPPMTGAEEPGSLRAAAHEDINLLTILPAASEPGLQVKTKRGQWLDVPSNVGNLIVNIGDMLQEVSRGYFPSTSHRVMNPRGENAKRSRISLPLFLHPRQDVVLSDRYTADSYLSERLKELGIKN